MRDNAWIDERVDKEAQCCIMNRLRAVVSNPLSVSGELHNHIVAMTQTHISHTKIKVQNLQMTLVLESVISMMPVYSMNKARNHHGNRKDLKFTQKMKHLSNMIYIIHFTFWSIWEIVGSCNGFGSGNSSCKWSSSDLSSMK